MDKTMWTSKRSLKLSILMLYVAAAALLVAMFFVPSMLDWYVQAVGRTKTHFYVLCSIFYCCCPLFFGILILLHKVLQNIRGERVFVQRNVDYLRYLSWMCFGLVPLILVGSAFFPVLFLVSVIVAFIGLLVRVVKNVMAAASDLKDENDLTI